MTTTPPSSTGLTEQEAFESWALSQGFSIERGSRGFYTSLGTNQLFSGWLGRAERESSHLPAPAAEVAKLRTALQELSDAAVSVKADLDAVPPADRPVCALSGRLTWPLSTAAMALKSNGDEPTRQVQWASPASGHGTQGALSEAGASGGRPTLSAPGNGSMWRASLDKAIELCTRAGHEDDTETLREMRTALATPPAAYGGAEPTAGLEIAARWLEKRADDYDAEHGNSDPDTGAREYPGNGAEYYNELQEMAESLRALKPSATSQLEDLGALVRQLAHSLRKAAPDHSLPGRAVDYLKRNGLAGSPLRSPAAVVEPQADCSQPVAAKDFERDCKTAIEFFSRNPSAALLAFDRLIAQPGADKVDAERRTVVLLNAAIEWISKANHGDNCYVTDEFPGNACVCGKESLLSYIDHEEGSVSVPNAWLDVLSERHRQIGVEGWTPEHDDKHIDGGLARAGATYAFPDLWNILGGLVWPWDGGPKFKSERENLVRADALILAEIERFDRAAARSHQPPAAPSKEEK